MDRAETQNAVRKFLGKDDKRYALLKDFLFHKGKEFRTDLFSEFIGEFNRTHFQSGCAKFIASRQSIVPFWALAESLRATEQLASLSPTGRDRVSACDYLMQWWARVGIWLSSEQKLKLPVGFDRSKLVQSLAFFSRSDVKNGIRDAHLANVQVHCEILSVMASESIDFDETEALTVKQIFAKLSLEDRQGDLKNYRALAARIDRAKITPIKPGRRGGDPALYSYDDVKRLLSNTL